MVMKIDTMRIIDKLIGKPTCIILALLLFLKRLIFVPSKEDKIPAENIKNILCIKMFGAGSLFLAWPLFKGLRERYPNARLHIITFESNREFLDILQCADVIHTVRKDTLFHLTRDLLAHFSYFLRNKIDISIDLEFFSKFSIILSIFYLSGIRVGLYARHAYRGDLLHYNISFNHYRHISEVFFELGKCVGIKYDEKYFNLHLPSMGNVYKSKIKSLCGLEDGRQYMVVNINSSDLCPMRKWPIESFAELIRKFHTKYPDRKIILIGAKNEAPYVSELFRMIDNTDGHLVDIAGKTSLLELLALLEHAELVVSNDSGPAHFTAGYDTPLIVLFGPETPVLYKPLGAKVTALFANVYCSPCINIYDNKNFLECEESICMKSIRMDDVMEAIDGFISRKSGADTEIDREHQHI